MRWKKSLLLILLVTLGAFAAFGDLYLNIYYDLKADFPAFVARLEAEGASQADIEGFLIDLSTTVAGYGTLTEDNFDSVMYRGLKEVLFIDGDMGMIQHDHRDFALALVGGFSDEIIATLETKQLSGDLAALNQGVRRLLLTEEREVLYPSSEVKADLVTQTWSLETFDESEVLEILQAEGPGNVLVTLETDQSRFQVPEMGTLLKSVPGVVIITPLGRVLFREETLKPEASVWLSLEKVSPSKVVFEVTDRAGEAVLASEPFEISLPYAPRSYQNPDQLTVFDLTGGAPVNLGGQYKAPFMTLLSRGSGEFLIAQNPVVFHDLEDLPYAGDKILSLAARGIIKGRGEGTYDPHAPVTRAEFAALTVRLLKISEGDQAPHFQDVQETDWFYQEVRRGFSSGLFLGRSDGIFDPHGSVSVQEVLTVLSRMLQDRGYPSVAFESPGGIDFTTVSPWARETIGTGLRVNLIEDLPRAELKFNEAADRAQVAGMLYEVLDRILGNQTLGGSALDQTP